MSDSDIRDTFPNLKYCPCAWFTEPMSLMSISTFVLYILCHYYKDITHKLFVQHRFSTSYKLLILIRQICLLGNLLECVDVKYDYFILDCKTNN